MSKSVLGYCFFRQSGDPGEIAFWDLCENGAPLARSLLGLPLARRLLALPWLEAALLDFLFELLGEKCVKVLLFELLGAWGSWENSLYCFFELVDEKCVKVLLFSSGREAGPRAFLNFFDLWRSRGSWEN